MVTLTQINSYYYDKASVYNYIFTHRSNSGREPRPVSIVLSSQVTNIAGNVPDGGLVGLTFEYSTVRAIKIVTECVY